MCPPRVGPFVFLWFRLWTAGQPIGGPVPSDTQEGPWAKSQWVVLQLWHQQCLLWHQRQRLWGGEWLTWTPVSLSLSDLSLSLCVTLSVLSLSLQDCRHFLNFINCHHGDQRRWWTFNVNVFQTNLKTLQPVNVPFVLSVRVYTFPCLRAFLDSTEVKHVKREADPCRLRRHMFTA